MPATSSLPQNWTLVLEQMQKALAHSIQLAETREAATAAEAQTASPAAVNSLLPPDLLAERLALLDKHADESATPLTALDQTLQVEEQEARRQLAMVADLRQRLADWAAGAVG
jgi:hypothetical protein